MSGNLSPPFFEGVGGCKSYNIPSEWTLINEWDSTLGELEAIRIAFGNNARGSSGAIWNLTGTRLTTGSVGNDTIRTFLCSTPWDPSTATNTATRSVTNPTYMYANRSGSILWCIYFAGDNFTALPMSNFSIGSGDELSNMTKAECEYTGSTDGNFVPTDNLDAMFYDGQTISLKETRKITFSAGNLDSFNLQPKQTVTWTISLLGASKMANDGKSFYRGASSQGVEHITMTTAWDATTATSTMYAIEPEISFRPSAVVINPENTTEVWIVGDNNGGIQLARMLTNACG